MCYSCSIFYFYVDKDIVRYSFEYVWIYQRNQFVNEFQSKWSCRWQTRCDGVSQADIQSTLSLLGSPNSGFAHWLDSLPGKVSSAGILRSYKWQQQWALSIISLPYFCRVHASPYCAADWCPSWQIKFLLFRSPTSIQVCCNCCMFYIDSTQNVFLCDYLKQIPA